MSTEDQSTLHSRMIEWAALSNQQRIQARLNFAEVKRIPADERKLKWEQYQKLVPVPPIAPAGHSPRILLAPPPAPAETVLSPSPPERAPAAAAAATPAVSVAPAAPASSGATAQPVPAEAQVPAPSTAADQPPSEASSSDQPASSNPLAPSAPVSIVPGLWRRMACWLYEGMLLFAVVFVSGWLFSTLGQMRDAMDSRRHLLQAFSFRCIRRVLRLVLDQGPDPRHEDLEHPHRRPGSGFLPPLAAIAPFKLSGGESTVLIFGWVAVWAVLARFHPDRQFWHDAWAGTTAHHLQTDEPPMSAVPKLPDPAVNPQKASQGPRSRLACHADLPARPARRLERARLPPGSHPVDRDDPGSLLLGRPLGRGRAARRQRRARDDRGASQHRRGGRHPTASGPSGTTSPSAPRTWAAPPCCFR
ncbi:putative laminin subunit alpha-like [Ditylenchus destructor]|uniref:Laminin subunit alpha-like n=1 Tax=Ditylenchus destructor TaxID=166010 RepID=A0AAD4MEQ1_9BILA|nr:putative laminin subunit alpha-like [Ditylenchus destructor]